MSLEFPNPSISYPAPERRLPQGKRIRVSILTNILHVGGAERWMMDLLSLTHRSVIDWVGLGVITGVSHPVISEQISKLCPMYSGPVECRDMVEHSDVVISWIVQNVSEYNDRDIPVVTVSHSPPESQWAKNFFESELSGITHGAAVSEAASTILPESLRHDAMVIPNGIDPGRMWSKKDAVEQLREWGVPLYDSVALFVGRLSAEKNCELIAGAVEFLPEHWHIVLIGESLVDSYAKSMQRDRVHIVPPTADVASAINAANAVIVASDYESFCYTTLEAWVAGVPVISTLVGIAKDNPEWVIDIPLHPTSERIAAELLDLPTGINLTRISNDAAQLYSGDRFGESWTNYIVGLYRTWYGIR